MNVNKKQLLAHCISERLLRTLYAVDDVSYQKLAEIVDKASDNIWLEIDSFFTFDN